MVKRTQGSAVDECFRHQSLTCNLLEHAPIKGSLFIIDENDDINLVKSKDFFPFWK